MTVQGTARLVTDSVEKSRHWKEEWAGYYRDGPRGEDYLLIQSRPTRLEIVSPRHGMMNDPGPWRPALLDLP